MIIPIQASQLQCCPLNRENLADLTDWKLQSVLAVTCIYSAHKFLTEFPETHDFFYRQVSVIAGFGFAATVTAYALLTMHRHRD